MTQLCLAVVIWVGPLWADGADQDLPDLAGIKMGAPLPGDLPLPHRYHFARNERELVAFSHDKGTGARIWATVFADDAGKIVGKHLVRRQAEGETVVLEFVVPASADHPPAKPDAESLEMGRKMTAADTPYFSRFWKQQIDAGLNRARGTMKALGKTERAGSTKAGPKPASKPAPDQAAKPASEQTPKHAPTTKPAAKTPDATSQPAGPTRIDEYAWYFSGWQPDPSLLPESGQKHQYPSMVTGSGSVLHPALTVAFAAHDLSGIKAAGFDRTIRFHATETRYDVRVTHLGQRTYRIAVTRQPAGEP